MTDSNKKKSLPDELKLLQLIPGVGPSIARDLFDLGYKTAVDLANEDPEDMYRRINLLRGNVQDRCLLYVFREAVYFASNTDRDPELLKWWNWKDKKRE